MSKAGLPAAGVAQAPGPGPAGWVLVWSDEFEGQQVDRTKWDFDIGNGFFDAHNRQWVPGWGNDELQYYTADSDNVEVSDSCIHIRAVKRSLAGCDYTSARLKTRRADGAALFAKRYGRFEFRARLPTGKGVWPALWLLPQDNAYGPWAASGEIDVVELIGDEPQRYLGSVHFGSHFPHREFATHRHELASTASVTDFHVYAIEWEPGEIRWLFDGQVWARQSFWWSARPTADGAGVDARSEADLNPWPAPFDQPFFILMNVAIGGTLPGLPDADTRFPCELVVDYVRVYDPVGGYGEPRPRASGRLPFSKG